MSLVHGLQSCDLSTIMPSHHCWFIAHYSIGQIFDAAGQGENLTTKSKKAFQFQFRTNEIFVRRTNFNDPWNLWPRDPIRLGRIIHDNAQNIYMFCEFKFSKLSIYALETTVRKSKFSKPCRWSQMRPKFHFGQAVQFGTYLRASDIFRNRNDARCRQSLFFVYFCLSAVLSSA